MVVLNETQSKVWVHFCTNAETISQKITPTGQRGAWLVTFYSFFTTEPRGEHTMNSAWEPPVTLVESPR